MASNLPPLKELLKSSEVEDPVNLYIHRPLAYGFVKAVHKTSMTPDMITVLTLVPGAIAGALFLWGTKTAMIVGGLLLWASAILDGADGILARAKGMSSVYGRAHDGLADIVVALITIVPAFVYLYQKSQSSFYLWFAVPVVACTAVHLVLYDYYKEMYLRATRLGRKSEDIGETELRKLLANSKDKSWVTRLAISQVLLPLVQRQRLLVNWLNPGSWRQKQALQATPESAEIYRKNNLGPMRLWMILSPAPHSYLLAICAMAGRFDVYFWLRFGVMNVIMVVALLWQRRATELTNLELAGLSEEESEEATIQVAAA